MSDFFERQAWRALGRPPVIRPRLVSLYEAGSEDQLIAAGPAESKWGNETATKGRNSIAQSSAVRSHSPEAAHHEQNPPSLSSPEVRREERSEGRSRTFSHREADDAPVLKDQALEPDLGRSSESDLRPSLPSKAPMRGEKEAVITNDAVMRSRASDDQNFSEEPGPGPLRTSNNSRSLGGAPRALRTEPELTNHSPTLVEKHVDHTGMRGQTIIAQQTEVQKGIAPLRINPPAIRASEGILGNRDSVIGKIEHADAAKQRPTINVTIGRVEIRAVTPRSPQQPAQRKPPRMSLDDYLNQKAGGGR
jgi:hypothetical protein